MEKISIILPSYNHAQYIGEAIESVLRQIHANWELIIVDDASTDNSWEIISSFFDPRIKKFRNEKNLGAETTHNLCLEKTTGKYIAVLNSDDYWHPNKLDIQVREMVNCDFCFTGTEVIGGNSPFAKNAPVDRIAWLQQLYYIGNFLCHASALIKKEVMEQYNPKFKQLPDYDLWVRLLLKGRKPKLIPDVLTYYRIHPNNTSAVNINNIIKSAIERADVLKYFLELNLEDLKQFFGYKEHLNPEYIPHVFLCNLPRDPLSSELFKQKLLEMI